ncbi:hypothetical protein HDU67_003212 [Dinochytrium kinnereticum]|nr:hypothetical protein HDU67_003212 [Dinochytrium kinnereticum]
MSLQRIIISVTRCARHPFLWPRLTSSHLPASHLILPSRQYTASSNIFHEQSEPGHSPYDGVGIAPYPPETIKILSSPIQGKDLDVDEVRGWLYMKKSRYIELLDKAFGKDGWTMQPRGPLRFTSPTGKTAFRTYVLYVQGRFVSEAIGDREVEKNYAGKEVNVDEVEERCQYAGMVRCCKDLGIASELWDKAVVDGLRSKYFEKSKVDIGGGKMAFRWIKKR